jgi:hypothetical protein
LLFGYGVYLFFLGLVQQELMAVAGMFSLDEGPECAGIGRIVQLLLGICQVLTLPLGAAFVGRHGKVLPGFLLEVHVQKPGQMLETLSEQEIFHCFLETRGNTYLYPFF